MKLGRLNHIGVAAPSVTTYLALTQTTQEKNHP